MSFLFIMTRFPADNRPAPVAEMQIAEARLDFRIPRRPL